MNAADADALRPLLEQLLQVHATSREVEPAVAFHALAAAAHAAEVLRDVPQLIAIAEHARRDLAWLDLHHPRHRLGSRSAATRGHQSVFAQLAVTAGAMQLRITAAQHLRTLSLERSSPRE